MTVERARALAEEAYEGKKDLLGHPALDHPRNVAARVSSRAQVVAWLHDTVEDDLIPLERLVEEGLEGDELEALLLITRVPEDGTYMDYIRKIAAAPGVAGEIAMEAKSADLKENMTRETTSKMMDMRRPGGRYDRASKIINAAIAKESH